MKIKMNRKDTYLLEDILLDVYYGFTPMVSQEDVERLLNAVQDTVYEADIAE